jgi:hypothetical protein
MVISASRRSDLPAYYADWLMGRIQAGYCLVRNPFDARRTRRVSLLPGDVDFLVLWTRDPRPLLPRLRELDDRGLRYYFQVTLTGYPSALEPGAPPVADALAALRGLADQIGPRRALWRYDPLFLAPGLDADYHRRNFEGLAGALEGATTRVTLSLLDEYAGTASRLARSGYPGVLFGSPRGGRAGTAVAATAVAAAAGADAPSALPPEPYPSLLAELAAIALSRGMQSLSCAEPWDLSSCGIEAGACVDSRLAASLWGLELPAGKDGGQRPACRCRPSVDIGAYGTCPRGCVYCYAGRGGGGRLLQRGPADEAL